MKKINQYTLSKYNFWFLLLVLMLSQPVIAQTSLPACTASIADTDGDSITDDDGVSGRIDIDKDGDGLIEICDLDGINEIRYQADGSGYKANENATKITQGCPVWGCIGYELVGSLNFNSATDYRNGSINTDWTVVNYASDTDVGWQPLPRFEAVFNGNGHIISNLQINRVGENNVGLFAALRQSGRVENIELVYPNVRGLSNVGSLVGTNNGVVINSYARDYDTDASTRDTTKYIEASSESVGGLVGRNNGGGTNIGHIINSGAVINVQIKENTSTDGIGANAGGLTGFNLNGAEIRNSYAHGDVKGPCGVGGLTANNFSTVQSDPEKNSKIINSYATGNVTTGFGNCNDAGNVRSGGLTAVNSGLIANSYTTSCFSSGTATVASTRRGGVVQNNSGTISNSYYQTTDCSGLQQTPSGSNKTQAELQTLIYTGGIYRTWLPMEWDFGDDSQYPVIRYTEGHDKDNPGCGYTSLPDCNALIKNQLPVGRTVRSTAPAVDLDIVYEFNDEVTISVTEDEIHPERQFPPLVFIGSIGLSGFSEKSSLFKIFANTQLYNFNFIPVLSIPAAPTPPLQPSDGEHITTWTSVSVKINRANSETKVVPAFSRNTFNYDIYFQSNYADGGNIFPRIGSNFILQPSPFNVVNKLYKLYDLFVGSRDLSLGDNYQVTDCINSSCDNDGESLAIPGSSTRTVTFNIRDTSTDPATSYGPFSIEYIPVESSKYVVVNSEVNDDAATFTADRALHVEVGDKVSVKVADSLVERDDISRPLYYYWHSSSGPTLFSGTQYGTSVSFDIDDTMFRNSQSGDAVLTLTMHDKYDMTAAAITEEIPVRIFGRLSLTSEDGEVLRDQVASTLHRVVLAADQPQAVISAVSLNKSATLTVDDSAAKVTAVNAISTFNASMVTVQVDEGDMTEFTITVTSGDADIIHIVRVFRRSGEVSLQDIEIADITFDEAITTPSSYIGLLSAATTSVTINQLILTISDTNASAISAITVDEDGSGGNSPVAVITPSGDFYEPGVEATIATDSFNLMAGSVVNITIRMRDAYVAETQSSETLADLSYTEGVYTIEIENALPLDNDDNGNGLIDIYTLDDLDKMRNQYTNMPSTCGINGESACEGFELRRSLDFNAAESYQDNTVNTAWTTGSGWEALASASPFNRVFEGNGFTISGLYIDHNLGLLYGLFSQLHDEGVIKNVGLLDVSIRANSDVGSLVGENNGTIINSYVTSATIVGNQRIGGLVGENRAGTIINSYATDATIVGGQRIGGLVGDNNNGDIISSFAYADVIGSTGGMGGLVGVNFGDSNIIDTYAAGTVASTQTVTQVGGLFGVTSSAGSVIRNSYAISRVMPLTGSSQVGGLVGDSRGKISFSYWNKTVNADLTTSGDAKTTTELQNPTAPGATPADTYYGWHTEAWDFGDSIHYPTLYYATTDSITVSACADNTTPSSALPRCGSRIPNQAVRNLIPDLPDLEVSEITINAQPAANSDGTINEGSNVNLMVNATGESESYSYAWSQISGNTLVLTTTDTATLNVAIPLDFVEQDATTAALTFQVAVGDGSLTIRRRAIITINQIDNGNPVIAVDVDVNVARVRITATVVEADVDGAGSFSYQWQQLVSGGWMDITDATTAAYWLPADVDARIQYRVKVRYTDGQGHMTNFQEGPFRVRLDDDNDGLIDIYTLEDLDAIRHQYSNMPNRCGSSNDLACNGFELRRSLDFNAVDSYQSSTINTVWTTGRGWWPIGRGNPTNFGSVFEGNGYTLSGLYINRSDSGMALFYLLNATGQIKNVGLLDVAVRGSWSVGSFVGYNGGSIINSYATGEVSGSSSRNGGLVGSNEYTGSIRSSFAKVRVSGSFEVGGLVGYHIGRITNSYSTGTVTVTRAGNADVGGLVGEVGKNDGEIINSYAIGRIISSDNNINAGGLVGKTTGTVIVSHWDTQTSGLQSSAGAATSRTTAQLKSPTVAGATPTDTYYGWSDKVWDFGNSEEYPALRYVAGGLNACNANMSTASDLPQCGSLIPHQGRTEEVALAVSEVTISSQPAANSDGTINEGSNVRLMVSTTGGSRAYKFSWSQTSGKALSLTTTNTATLNVAIPPDFIAEDAATTMLTFAVMVDDGMSTINRSKVITINKIDNGSVSSAIADITPEQLRITPSGTDPDGAGVFSYQWQQQALGDIWEDINAATMATYSLPTDVSASIRYRVTISYTDGQGYSTAYQSGPFRGRVDDDGDGLIDIYMLEDLDNIRNQYANMPSTCAVGNAQRCRGFELRRSLDFNAVESYQNSTINTVWTTGSGWTPIGLGDLIGFGSLFDGNGYTISGLQINRNGANIALFSVLHTTGQINNVGLLDVALRGDRNVGSLVGYNDGSIINSYAIGEVSGSGSSMGGLVGNNGYTGLILSSFANVNIIGLDEVGGLVGLHRGRITNSYAVGTVSVTSTGDASVGGLVAKVGRNDGEIINSYAIGRVIPNADNAPSAGGLVGVTTGTVIASYWDTQTSERQSSAGGDGAIARTTVQLRSPTAPGTTPMATYYGWDAKVWDFGDNNHYPALRYTHGGLDACNDDMKLSSMRPLCGIPLPNQSGRDKGLGALFVLAGDDDISEQLMPTFSPLRVSYEMLIVSTAENIQLTLRPYALNDNAMITITDQDNSGYFSSKSSGALSDPIVLSDSLTITIVVTESIAESMMDTTYTLTLRKIAPLAISGVMLNAAMIAEGSTASVTFDVSGGTGIYQYAYKLIAGEDEIMLPPLAPPAALVMPTDIVAAADSERAVELNIIVSDDSGRRVEHNEALTIKKVDNGLANIAASRATSRTVTVKVGGDPDGDAVPPAYMYQWQWRAAEDNEQWVAI